ncbi:MAG: AAA family ATPase [Oscillospiraceae bacterium]|jgi:ABC-type multidrug transport system ATPase subunit|nr:AAA family ATPase [Oscillospiraceae bacterium]
MDKFSILQNAVLADDYYNCSDDLRFNLYLIILTDKLNSIVNLRNVQCDYNYGRKLILNETLANIFFDSFACNDTNIRPNDILRRSNNSEFVRKLASVESSLIKRTSELSRDSYVQMRVFSDSLTSLRKRNSFFSLFPYRNKDRISARILRNYLFFNSGLSEFEFEYGNFLYETDHFAAEQSTLSNKVKRNDISRRISRAINDDSILECICEITIKGYKNFNQSQSIQFSRVNLLFGENGSGKTTIINSIKAALTGTLDSNNSNCEVNVFGKTKNNKSLQFNNKNRNLKDYAQLWYNVSENDMPKYFDKYNYFDGGRALDFALNDLDIADLFMDASVNRIIKTLYERKCFFARQVEFELKSVENNNIKTQLPSVTNSMKTLKNERIDLREIRDGIYRINLTKPFNKYSRKVQKAINSVWYQNLIILRESLKSDYDYSKEKNISNSIMEELQIYDRIKSLFLLLTSARDYNDLHISESFSLAAIKTNSNIPVLPINMSVGQRVCFALAALLASFLENSKAPNILILDEPVANLDDLHLLNMLDIIRQLSIRGTQVFFTTANESVAKLFKRKFGFMQEDLRSIKVNDIGDEVIISDF